MTLPHAIVFLGIVVVICAPAVRTVWKRLR